MSSRATEQNLEQSRRWGILFILLLLLGVLCLVMLSFIQSNIGSAGLEFISVDLHSQLEADYKVNPDRTPLPQVRLDIIWDAIYDRDPEAADLENRQAALLNGLLTPVPIVTPSLLTCQGIHFIYAGRDTWTDSANPTAVYGNDTLLKLGRDGNQFKHLLLYFSINDTIPPNTGIHSARLEMDVAQMRGSFSSDSLMFASLIRPFSEVDTNWSNQPEPNILYHAPELATGSIHVWDVTDMVRDWLLGHSRNDGLVIEPQSSADFTFAYYSREIIDQASSESNAIAIPVGPRLVITCGGVPSQAIAFSGVTPTPTPTNIIPSPSTGEPAELTTTAIFPTPVLPLLTPTSLPPPTEPIPTPTVAGLLPTPGQAPPTPTLSPPSPDNTPDPDDDDTPTSPPLPVNADLVLSKTESSDPIIAGNNLIYTLNLTNNGPASATGVTVFDTLPAGVSLLSSIASQGTGCTGTMTITCNLGTMTLGGKATVTITVTVNSSTTGMLTNSANVSANETDPNLQNNTAIESTTIINNPNIQISKSADKTVLSTTESPRLISFTITMHNNGTTAGTITSVSDILQTGELTYTDGTSKIGGIIISDPLSTTVGAQRVFTWSIPSGQQQIAAGGTLSLTYQVTVTSTAGMYLNRATATGFLTSPIVTSTTPYVNAIVWVANGLFVNKSVNVSNALAGSIITYTITYGNLSGIDEQRRVLLENIPSDTNLVVDSISVNGIQGTYPPNKRDFYDAVDGRDGIGSTITPISDTNGVDVRVKSFEQEEANNPNIPANEIVTMIFAVRITDTATSGTVITNAASIVESSGPNFELIGNTVTTTIVTASPIKKPHWIYLPIVLK